MAAGAHSPSFSGSLQADKDGSGTLDLSEYASAIMVKRMDGDRIRKAFEYFSSGMSRLLNNFIPRLSL